MMQQADLARAGEGDQGDVGMGDEVGPISCRGRSRLTTPGGTPAARRMRASLAPMTGVAPAGFMMTVLPVTRAAVVMPLRMASGKFHGAITAATPRGS